MLRLQITRFDAEVDDRGYAQENNRREAVNAIADNTADGARLLLETARLYLDWSKEATKK